MTDHVSSSRTETTNQATTLRAELKVWEKEFASNHGGKKAGREDIKQNPDIAAKYKEYGRLKSLEASLARRENRRKEGPGSQSRKRKHASPTGPASTYLEVTPRKSSKALFATPSNNRTAKTHPSQLDPYDSPSTFRRLFSPSTHRQGLPAPSPLKAAIGPTPQRDGKTLGLFDMLSESGGSNATPSARKQKDALAEGFQTPSKPRAFDPIAEVPEEEEESTRPSRTPASSTKQFYLANLFATPTTMRYAAMVEAEDERTPQRNQPQPHATAASPEQNPSETPSFLRRSNSGRFPPPTTNNSSGLSPIVSRKPLQFAGRGLSHLVKGLRAMEAEREDDDWDVLREIEAEQEAAQIEVADSQFTTEQQGRPYKKKGQKRTTRKVNMRPVAPRPKPRLDPAPATAAQDENSDEGDDELVAVPETQLAPDAENGETDPHENGEASDIASLRTISEGESASDAELDTDSDGDPEYDEKLKPLPRAKSFSERMKEAVARVKPKSKEPQAKTTQAAQEEQNEKVAKVRKVNPQAHANYRSLKIRNRSGASRGRGRFRRR